MVDRLLRLLTHAKRCNLRLTAKLTGLHPLLERLLRIYGYYDAQVYRSVGGTDGLNGDNFVSCTITP